VTRRPKKFCEICALQTHSPDGSTNKTLSVHAFARGSVTPTCSFSRSWCGIFIGDGKVLRYVRLMARAVRLSSACAYLVLTLCGLALRSTRMTRPRVQRTSPWRNPSLWKHSTIIALIDVIDNIIINRNYVLGIYLDLKRHLILWITLYYSGSYIIMV